MGDIISFQNMLLAIYIYLCFVLCDVYVIYVYFSMKLSFSIDSCKFFTYCDNNPWL